MVIIATIVGILALGAGVAIGLAIGYEHPVGDLRVDRSDPTSPPYLFLELDTDVYSVMRRKHVLFRVKLKDFIPHE